MTGKIVANFGPTVYTALYKTILQEQIALVKSPDDNIWHQFQRLLENIFFFLTKNSI